MTNVFAQGRPNVEFLTKEFGVRPPPLYVRFAQWACDKAGGDMVRVADLYGRLTGLDSRTLNMAYPGTPAELFAIGGTGIDGEHAGFVVMTPELPYDDCPWMSYVPAGHDFTY